CKLLTDAGVAVYGCRVLVLCDNQFATYILAALEKAGADVEALDHLSKARIDRPYDAILVALQPREYPILTHNDARFIGDRWPGSVVAQFWGDIDRASFAAASVPVWPFEQPAQGHMSILPSAIGPEPIVRLQAGGLKVGEILWRQRGSGVSHMDA